MEEQENNEEFQESRIVREINNNDELEKERIIVCVDGSKSEKEKNLKRKSETPRKTPKRRREVYILTKE